MAEAVFLVLVVRIMITEPETNDRQKVVWIELSLANVEKGTTVMVPPGPRLRRVNLAPDGAKSV